MYFSFINLWCSKNLVDTQYLLWRILEHYWSDFYYDNDPFSEEVDLVFLNTCWFISSGREEMFENIFELLNAWKKVCLLWCAVQYFEKLVKEEKLSDEEIKKREILKQNKNLYFLSWDEVAHFSPDMINKKAPHIMTDFVRSDNARAYTNLDLWYEYLKIAEGCNNHCAFCIIPKIRGKQVSLPIKQVIENAKNLIQQGAKELILIAQDSTRYWIDLYWKSQLFELLEEIDHLEWDFHYRVLYLYPDLLTQQHLQKLTQLKKFIPYFDIPFQHSSEKLLKSMWRFYDYKQALEFLKYIKEHFKESFIRTNFIIWFPWETEEDFQHLLSFISEDYFDNIALFEYHDEPLAPSYKFKNKVDDETIRERFERANTLVNELLWKREEKLKNKEQEWRVMDIEEDENWEIWYTVLPFLHCPEVDESYIISWWAISQATHKSWKKVKNDNIQIGDSVTFTLL